MDTFFLCFQIGWNWKAFSKFNKKLNVPVILSSIKFAVYQPIHTETPFIACVRCVMEHHQMHWGSSLQWRDITICTVVYHIIWEDIISGSEDNQCIGGGGGGISWFVSRYVMTFWRDIMTALWGAQCIEALGNVHLRDTMICVRGYRKCVGDTMYSFGDSTSLLGDIISTLEWSRFLWPEKYHECIWKIIMGTLGAIFSTSRAVQCIGGHWNDIYCVSAGIFSLYCRFWNGISGRSIFQPIYCFCHTCPKFDIDCVRHGKKPLWHSFGNLLEEAFLHSFRKLLSANQSFRSKIYKNEYSRS